MTLQGEEIMTEFKIEAIGSQHLRAAFSCGVPALDRYLQKQARQDVSKGVAAVFVITPDGATIAGFYTLSSAELQLRDLPDEFVKKLPRYPSVPATLLGRLAVSTQFRGRGLGEVLLIDAMRRVLIATSNVASSAIVVDAKDEAARQFYLRYDFVPLPEQPNRLIFRVKKIAKQFGESDG
jgi:predicted GNAT family N-acyltransferase